MIGGFRIVRTGENAELKSKVQNCLIVLHGKSGD